MDYCVLISLKSIGVKIMNKKIYLIINIFFNMFFLLRAHECNIFKYNKFSGVDYYTGFSLSNFANEDVINGNDVLRSVEINIKSQKSNETTLYTYSDGLLKTINSKVRDGRNSYFSYNSSGYLESVDLQKRIYTSDNECILMEDDKILFKISIQDNDDKKRILFEQLKFNSIDFYLSQIFEYSYEEGKLESYKELYLNPQGKVYSNRFHEFEYMDNKLISHVITVNDQIRWTYNLSYNENQQLIEVMYKDEKNPQNNRIKTFEKYDIHGNWLYSKDFYNNVLLFEISRKIDYSE